MSRLTRAELDEIERFCENSPTWTLERVPRLIAHVRAQDEALKDIEEYADAYAESEEEDERNHPEARFGPAYVPLRKLVKIARAARMEE